MATSVQAIQGDILCPGCSRGLTTSIGLMYASDYLNVQALGSELLSSILKLNERLAACLPPALHCLVHESVSFYSRAKYPTLSPDSFAQMRALSLVFLHFYPS